MVSVSTTLALGLTSTTIFNGRITLQGMGNHMLVTCIYMAALHDMATCTPT